MIRANQAQQEAKQDPMAGFTELLDAIKQLRKSYGITRGVASAKRRMALTAVNSPARLVVLHRDPKSRSRRTDARRLRQELRIAIHNPGFTKSELLLYANLSFRSENAVTTHLQVIENWRELFP